MLDRGHQMAALEDCGLPKMPPSSSSALTPLPADCAAARPTSERCGCLNASLVELGAEVLGAARALPSR